MMANNSTSLGEKDIYFTRTTWNGKMHFESSVDNHIINFDKLPLHGGEDKGPRPKPLILSAIGGCTGMEIVSILEKMRLKIQRLEIEVTAELTEGQQKIYKSVHIIFNVQSQSSDRQKIKRAIHLAEKYCGVLLMVRQFAKVTSEIKFL